MYFQDFNGLDLLRAHASMTGLPISNGLDTGNPLGLHLPLRDHGNGRLRSPSSPNNGNNNSPRHNNSPGNTGGNVQQRPSSPRPGSANRQPPTSHGGLTLSSLNALNLIQTPKPGLKPPTYSSPPPIPCNPEHNICKLIEYRGAKVAAFMVDSRELICLPQAFELFLKHLVGGLHTVYTKLKRLEITPIVCNVEQVRILRGLGAIQPGVNRCKLISCAEFDTLYEDCTNSNARPGRPPKRVHSSTVDADVLEKLKRRKLDMPGDYPYDNRFYDRKLMNGFPPVGYPSMPQFPNLFSMHHLMQPVSMAMASHIGLRTEGAVPKLDRTTSESGIVSPRARDDRLGLLGMYGPPTGMDPRLHTRPLDMESANKPLNLQINGHLKDKDSEGSRTDDEADGDDDKMTDEEKHDDGLDDCYDSDEYQSLEGRDKLAPGPIRPLHSPLPEGDEMGPQPPPPVVFTDFDGFADKLNALVRALVDQAKSVERRIGDEKNRVSLELVKEKERRLDLEKEIEEERRRREFFQRRVRRLKNALKLLPESAHELTNQTPKTDRTRSESSPEPVVRNTQEAGTLDSDSDKALNTSSCGDTERKTDSNNVPDRPLHRRDQVFESFTPGRRSPRSPSPVKFQYHPIVAAAPDI